MKRGRNSNEVVARERKGAERKREMKGEWERGGGGKKGKDRGERERWGRRRKDAVE